VADDVWEYFDQRRREHRDLSVAESDDFLFVAEEGSGGLRGQIFGAVTLWDVAFLSVHEVVLIEDGSAHREEYGYFLVINGAEIWGHERDPSHDPPVHCHGSDHSRHAAKAPISFREAVEMAWETSSIEAEYGPGELELVPPRFVE